MLPEVEGAIGPEEEEVGSGTAAATSAASVGLGFDETATGLL